MQAYQGIASGAALLSFRRTHQTKGPRVARLTANRWILIVVFLAAVAAFAATVWRASYIAATNQLERRGRAELALASDSLTGRLERYRELAVIMADHPSLIPVLQQGVATAQAQALLLEVADKTGALDIEVVGRDGRTLASAQPQETDAHIQSEYVERALDGALGVAHQFVPRYQKRAFIFGAPIFSQGGPVVGVIVVTANGEAVEAAWRGDRPALFFSDQQGKVFLSNRTELLSGIPQPINAQDDIAGHEIWRVDAGRYLPRAAMHLTLGLPIINMTGEVLMDIAPARRLAGLQAAVAAALCLAFGAALFAVTERRRQLAAQNALLEGRVARRTRALERAQADLVQAGKLSALGQMSAGISHELNQPLMAIRSFAENGQAFLDRDKPDVAAENLGRISELARRMGRIIQNLRAFARQEETPMSDVDIIAVIADVIELSAPKAKEAGVAIEWAQRRAAIWVRGGEVRLQQVLTNLVSNAIDAMEGTDEKRVIITVDQGKRLAITVRDTGPGIAEPDKIFDPFYTTKEVGTAYGMGLGLSISYGIVQSFGGDIQGRNHPDGGAVFTLLLDLANDARGDA